MARFLTEMDLLMFLLKRPKLGLNGSFPCLKRIMLMALSSSSVKSSSSSSVTGMSLTEAVVVATAAMLRPLVSW